MSILSKLEWHCRRGTRELDLLVQSYLHQLYPQDPPQLQNAFERLLENSDPELYDLLIGRQESNDRDIALIIARIRERFKA